jgi:hypothetical protein
MVLAAEDLSPATTCSSSCSCPEQRTVEVAVRAWHVGHVEGVDALEALVVGADLVPTVGLVNGQLA